MPEAFTAEHIADMQAKILDGIAEGKSLRTIRREDPDLPAMSTIFKWLASDAAFAEQYARAREAQADALFDEVLEIADDGRNDWMERHGDDDAGYIANGEHIQRSRVRIDARKWMAGKLRPKRYGEKLEIGGTGENGEHVHEVRWVIAARPADNNT